VPGSQTTLSTPTDEYNPSIKPSSDEILKPITNSPLVGLSECYCLWPDRGALCTTFWAKGIIFSALEDRRQNYELIKL